MSESTQIDANHPPSPSTLHATRRMRKGVFFSYWILVSFIRCVVRAFPNNTALDLRARFSCVSVCTNACRFISIHISSFLLFRKLLSVLTQAIKQPQARPYLSIRLCDLDKIFTHILALSLSSLSLSLFLHKRHHNHNFARRYIHSRVYMLYIHISNIESSSISLRRSQIDPRFIRTHKHTETCTFPRRVFVMSHMSYRFRSAENLFINIY